MGESSKDHDNQFEAVNLLPPDLVCQPTETELAHDGSTGGSDFDGGIRAGRDGAGLDGGILPEDGAQHGTGEVDGEDIVGIGEETDAGDDDGADMVPAKGSLIDLRESETPTFVGVFDMGELVVEVLEGGITTFCLGSHGGCVVYRRDGSI